MDKGHLALLKKINRKLVLDTIRNNHPISRAQISRKVQLSRSTVSSLVEELIEKKLISEAGKGESTKNGGRKSIELVFNSESSYGIGVDIGGTKTLMCIVDLDGKLLLKKEVKTDKVPQKSIEIIKQFVKSSFISEDQIATMGIGMPAIIDSKKGLVIDSPNLGWQNVDFLRQLKKAFSFPIFMNNDVNCAIYGEKYHGVGDNADNLIFIAIGTGVGSAIICDGVLVEGDRFAAGEVGYFLDRKDVEQGKKYKVGEFGPFESRTSGTGLSTHYGDARILFEKYKEKDPHAQQIMEEFVMDLSIVISNITSLLNPKKVIIGGGVSCSMDDLVQKIREKVLIFSPVPVEIELSNLRGDAGAIGAVSYAFEKLKDI